MFNYAQTFFCQTHRTVYRICANNWHISSKLQAIIYWVLMFMIIVWNVYFAHTVLAITVNGAFAFFRPLARIWYIWFRFLVSIQHFIIKLNLQNKFADIPFAFQSPNLTDYYGSLPIHWISLASNKMLPSEVSQKKLSQKVSIQVLKPSGVNCKETSPIAKQKFYSCSKDYFTE